MDGLSIMAFFGQVAWQVCAGGWWTALAVAGLAIVGVIIPPSI
jgi:hypothetical protein